MNCSACGLSNRDQALYCVQCGAALGRACVGCGTLLPAAARFCDACGAHVTSTVRRPERGDAERRQVTVLFADLIGSTPLAESVEPEELRDLILGYQRICGEAIQRLGGYLAHYYGDGVVAYFGYPVAQEYDARAAVRAGLEIATGMRKGHHTRKLAARIGIHTGMVVVGEMGAVDRPELVAMGSAPNVAARVQALAQPNTVVISEVTQRLTRGFFDCIDLGPQTLKGIATPMHVFEVCADRDVQGRVEAAAFGGLTPLVGRAHEIGVLLYRWEQATQGSGQIVQAVGEPGIGKSRLVQELKERLAGTAYRGLDAPGSPHGEHSALMPVTAMLQRAAGWQPGDEPAVRLARLERAVAPYLAGRPDAISLLAGVLSLPVPAEYPPLDLDPQRAKQQTLEAVVSWLLGLTTEQPLLLVMEDVHWFDPSSLELLALLLPRVPAARLLVLLLYRPTFQSPWAAMPHLTTLPLQRLAPEQAMAMIELVIGGRSLPRSVVADICAKAEGVPLYVEELTKMLLESGQLVEHDGRLEVSDAGGALTIPVTLQELLAARLDRLAPVKEVVQLGAALGRSFSYEQLRAVSLLDDVSLNMELGRLVEADILHVHGAPPDATYVFKHALIQDAAYDSLVSNRRREYHRRIAAALTERFPQICETEPELIARHWERAGNAEAAVAYLLRAGERALERSGYVEAERHIEHGLTLFESLPAVAQRAQCELELRLALGAARVAAKGFAAPEVAAAYTRARELCQATGETGQALYTVLSGLLLYHQSRAELTRCLDLTHERLELAERLGDAGLTMQVYENFGTLAFWRGDFTAVLGYLEQSVARWTRERDRALARTYGTLSAVVCEAYAGQTLWFLGYPDQALARSGAAVQQARAFGHANSLALAMSFLTSTHLLRGDAALTQQSAEALIAYATEQQLPFWVGSGTINRGWALAAQGRVDEGLDQLLEGIGSFQGTGALIGGRFCVATLARTYLEAGRVEQAEALFDGALLLLEACEDRFFDAELLRVRGEVLLAKEPADVAAAEAYFNDALALARSQGSPSLELRAVTSLARLWQRTGRGAAARELVQACRSRFTEGFATADLVAAAQCAGLRP